MLKSALVFLTQGGKGSPEGKKGSTNSDLKICYRKVTEFKFEKSKTIQEVILEGR